MSYTFATVDDVELAPEDLVALRADLLDERRFRREQLDGLTEAWPGDGDLRSDQKALAHQEVLAALAAAGRYGSCSLCDRPIPLPRLRILPHARYCGPCHQLKEAVS